MIIGMGRGAPHEGTPFSQDNRARKGGENDNGAMVDGCEKVGGTDVRPEGNGPKRSSRWRFSMRLRGEGKEGIKEAKGGGERI